METDEDIWNELKNYSPDLLLEKSIIISFLPGVKKALNEGANVQRSELIYTAALFGDEVIIKYLLNSGVLVTQEVVDDIKYELISGDDSGTIEVDDEENRKIIELISSYIKEKPKKKINKFKQFINKIKR